MSDPIVDRDLFFTASATDALVAAWTKVWRNGGCAGGDNVSLDAFRFNAVGRLSALSDALRDGSYAPKPLREATIPKRSGGTRLLRIPAIVDRVAQTAVAQALTPVLEPTFEDASFGYRPGRSVRQAVERVQLLARRGRVFVVDADIDDFFDSVRHDRVLALLAEHLSSGPLTELIALWLEHGGQDGRGLPQGSPLSPLLANLYLDDLDGAFSRGGARIVRYADDFVILCATERGAEQALDKARRLLREAGLSLDPEKTRVLPIERGLRFLGHFFLSSFAVPSPEENEEIPSLMRRIANDDAAAAEKAEAEAAEEEVQRNAGLDPGFRILHLATPGRRLNARNEAFCVEEPVATDDGSAFREIFAVHAREVDRIDLAPRAVATEAALKLARASDTLIAFVDGHGETESWLGPSLSQHAARHLAQARVSLDPDARLALSKHFVDGRLRNQRALLRRLNRTRKEPGTIRALAEINVLIRRVPHEAAVDSLMGVEGRAAALYWPAFGRMLDGAWSLTTRERDKPGPVAIMLNFTSSLLSRDIAVALDRAKLHPGFGIFHVPQNYRDSAVYDLMEEFRAPLCESVVATAINTHRLSREMFSRREDGDHHMSTAALRVLIRTYEQAADREVKSQRTGRRRPWRAIMIEQAMLLAAHVEGRDVYEPYVMDY